MDVDATNAAAEALQQVLNNHQAANHATIMESTTCDPSYTSEFNRFTDWVQSEPDLNTPVAPFLTRINVNHYFTRVIARRTCDPKGIGRVANALNWYGTHREHVGATPEFECKSSAVDAALVAQKAHFNLHGGSNEGSDPHKGLKDILPVASKILMMEHIYRARNDWGPASVNFTWGQNGAIRGASNRKMGFCDLNLSHGFGPEMVGPLSRALLLVLRRGPVHEDHHDTDKQVCSWRQRDYRLCSVFATALYVIFQITRMTISFLHADKKERASWWDIPLIDWTLYNGKLKYRFAPVLYVHD
jgi:hypothetical protein